VERDKTAPNIFDNTPDRELIEVIKNTLKKSKEAKFAIGYFFLSGFSLLRENFPENFTKTPFLRIVMGNETTYPTKEELVEGYSLRELFKKRMIEDLQNRPLTEDRVKKLRALRELIAENVIDVRLFDKSRLHAKLYLFLTRPDEKYESPGLSVVGSSNFTAEGLTKNRELNVLLTSREEVLYLNDWFDHLWDESIEFREDLLKVIDFSGALPETPSPRIGRLVDPITLFKYLVYKWTDGRVLNLTKKDILAEFQIVGVLNAVDIVGTGASGYNGAILADSVGLGKSFMASAIIEEFLYGKHPAWLNDSKKEPGVLLILPPSTIAQWEELLIGRIDDNTRDRLKNGEKIRIESEYFFKDNYKRLLNSHGTSRAYALYDGNGDKVLGKIYFLSLGLFQGYEVKGNEVHPELKRLAQEYDLVVIDEAHKYRNKNTNRWKAVRALQKKSDGFPNRFLLLTATPLNNSIYDIYNLIRLFIDDTFTPFMVNGTDVNRLVREYSSLKKDLEKRDDDKKRRDLQEIATRIKQDVLDRIMVLRTRKYIQEQFRDMNINGRPLIFKDPVPYSLDCSPIHTRDYQTLIKSIGEKLNSIQFEHTKLYGTRFVVFEEETVDEEGEKKHYVEIADLFRLLLSKRLESDIYPFETTLRRIYQKEKIFHSTLLKGQKEINADKLKNLIKEAVAQAKIDKDLEDMSDEYAVEEDKGEWFYRVIEILMEYANESLKGEKLSDMELLKRGLEIALDRIENDLRLMDELFSQLDGLKEKGAGKPESFWSDLSHKQLQFTSKDAGRFKVLGAIPRDVDDVVDSPVYQYREDPKIEALKQILGDPSARSEKLERVPSLNGKKVIIFTQYKDTAYYLNYNLRDWANNEVNLHMWLKDVGPERIKIGLVTGETEIATKMNYLRRFAPQANNGWEEVEKYGEIEILVSTDALSEGVNLQDADAVINYDLPWNPMVIVQRVGRVNRIGNDKDVMVINFVPSSEIEVMVGILNRLKEKIEDITLVIGKESRILSPDEEISIETFGERIKEISKQSMTDLEQYGVSEDFKQFIPEGIPKEQLDEYRLLNFIQYNLQYTQSDFEDVMGMSEGPYYSFLRSDAERFLSVYEFYRGEHRVMKKIRCVDTKTGTMSDATPIAFLDLVEKREKEPEKIEDAMECLSSLEGENEKDKEELKAKYQPEVRGFLHNLYNALYLERERASDVRDKFNRVLIALKSLPQYPYSRDIKDLLTGKSLVEVSKDTITVKDLGGTIGTLFDFLSERNLISTSSLEVSVKHLGWYYELY